MPRTISSDVRSSLEASSSGEVILCFATITHPDLSTPARAVNDIVDYIYGGNRFYGIPFEFQFVSDGERPPTAKLRMQNVDQRIGAIVLGLSSYPRLKLEILVGSDFGAIGDVFDAVTSTTRRTRSPIGTPAVEAMADHLRLDNVSGDAVAVEADIKGFDLTQEPWPRVRTTRDVLPALYR